MKPSIAAIYTACCMSVLFPSAQYPRIMSIVIDCPQLCGSVAIMGMAHAFGLAIARMITARHFSIANCAFGVAAAGMAESS